MKGNLRMILLTRHLVLTSPYFTFNYNANKLKIVKFGSVVKQYKFDNIIYKNEPILGYKNGSKERKELEKSLDYFKNECTEIPIIVGGNEIKTSSEQFQVMPHSHGQIVAKFYHADECTIKEAIRIAMEAKQEWDSTSYEVRLKMWNKAANLMAHKYRGDLVAATMLGQSKTVYQAEIDAGAELIDFIRLNSQFCRTLLNYKPISTDPVITINHFLLRGLGGFVAAISPFNFTAIGGNLAYTPALMGNVVLWKPSEMAILSSWIVFKIMKEAGVPDGVVNFVPADGPTFGNVITTSPYLAGINFTGSVPTFQTLWKKVGEQFNIYKNFPRLSGECGGKNYHFVHPSADVNAVVATTIRSAFEYGGQKCSACSRLYVPESLWESKIKKPLCLITSRLVMGDVCDYKTFIAAVINEKAFKRIKTYLEYANTNAKCKIVAGGQCFSSCGYFIEPTIIEVKDPNDRLFKEEIFGPILAVYIYKDDKIQETIDLVHNVSNYALTGSVFASDECFLAKAVDLFKTTAGNLYLNDKSTGAIVGQQPFGGDQLSGTNDKPGCPYYLLRWTSPIVIKETFVPQTEIYYPYMGINES